MVEDIDEGRPFGTVGEEMDRYLDSKETFPAEMRDRIRSEYERMWTEKLEWLKTRKGEEQC